MPESPSPNLHLPGAMHYECVKCGRGCEDFQRITVAPEVFEKLTALDAARLAQDGGPARAFTEPDPKPPGGHILRKVVVNAERGRSACCFLREDKLCAIHCEHGIESKPHPCRSFPFGFTSTEGGIYTGLSFACTAVLDDHGPEVSSQRGDIETTLGFSPVRKTMDRLMFTGGVPISWEQYELIEADLMELLESPVPVGSRLIAQSIYIQLLSRLLHDARHAAGAGWEERPEANSEAIAVFRRRMRAEAGGPAWTKLLMMAERPAQTRLLRRVFLGYCLAFRRACDGGSGRVGALMKVMTSYWAYALGRGGLDVPRLSKRQALQKMRRVVFDPDASEHRGLLVRYLRHCIGRKDLIARDSVRLGHNMLLMNYGLIHWHAAAFAADAGRAAVEPEDLKEGLRAVEQYFGYHSQFAEFFTQYPQLKGVMEAMFHRPVYSMAMARAEM